MILIQTLFLKVGSRANLDSLLTYFEHDLFFGNFGLLEFIDVAKNYMADQTYLTAGQWLRFEKVWNKLNELWTIFRNILSMQSNFGNL